MSRFSLQLFSFRNSICNSFLSGVFGANTERGSSVFQELILGQGGGEAEGGEEEEEEKPSGLQKNGTVCAYF